MKNKKIVVGISGGVDSATTAYLLKKEGYDVIGIFMQNWDSYANLEHSYNNHKDHCDSFYEYQDAKQICDFLNIELHKVDFIKEYWNEVFQTFLDQYKKGWTPNPDVLCNKYIKFGHLLKYARQKFDCDYLATGHYAKVKHEPNQSLLLRAKDENKDQTYFLCDLNQEQLKYAMFPLADLTKQEVRQIAKQAHLPVWDKKDSTGICFIGERNFSDFLSNYLKYQTGDIIDIVSNQIIGKHQGVSFYTIGQNQKLGLGGQKEKYFVCDKNLEKNIVYVVSETYKSKYLDSCRCLTESFNFISKPHNINNLQVRFRHRQKLINCSIEINEHNEVMIYYPDKSFAVTKGQYAVLYEQDVCLGGAIVKEIYFN